MYQINFHHPVHVYFAGIGGISMSGLAEVLLEEGFPVSGSDLRPSPLTRKLEENGARIFYGQKAENITKDIDVLVYTSAICENHPEIAAAKALSIPLLSRAQLLGQMMKNYETPIAVSGTHGKTTTSSMISEILLKAHTDPTLSIGGILKSINGNIRVGRSGYFVTEACEYTNSFLSFYPKISIILNVEEDHLDFFKDIEDIRSSFHRFALLLPADGRLIINGSIPGIELLTKDVACPIITYGDQPSFDYSPSEISYDEKGCTRFTLNRKNFPPRRFQLKVPGEHNIYNAIAAIALADLLAVDSDITAAALSEFQGTDRRFEYKGMRNGASIIDDYAHHPTEITATLKAAANYPHETLRCVFQPHTYTRTRAFLQDFARALSLADQVILADIYAARETDTLGISSADLQAEIKKLGTECLYFPSFAEIEHFLSSNLRAGDLLITMGAGDVVKIGENLLK